MNNKFGMQDSQYREPYHHFVSMDGNFYKMLDWGLSYYGYISRVIHHINIRKEAMEKIADVGCGDGKLLFELSSKYPKIMFYGYDLSLKAINFAKAYSFGFPNLEFKAEDFSNSEIENFDVITCIETMEHIPDEVIPGFTSMLRGKISNNGILIITVPTVVVPLNKKHYRHYNEAILSSQLSGKFKVVHFEWVHDGSGSKIIRFLLVNRFYILRFEPIRRMLINIYNKMYLITDNKKGEHLLAICEPV